MSENTAEKKLLTVSASPHRRTQDTTRGIMLDVIIAMIPALVLSVVLFGFDSLKLVLVSVAFSVLFEWLCRKVMKRDNTIGDLSAIVTGILLAFNLPSTMPLYMVIIGDAVAIIVVKQFFGGIGQNFVNPALVGRIVLMMSFPTYTNNFAEPFAWKIDKIDAVSGATPLALFAGNYSHDAAVSVMNSSELPGLSQMFFGIRAGCLGETCAAALIVGALYLFIRKVISPTIPLCYIGTVAVIMFIRGGGSLSFTAYQVMAGGLLLGAIFMATDYTTSPMSFKGKVIYAIGCGILTSLIRIFGSLPEGVSFSIILMNILVPHIERLTHSRPFGAVKEKKEKKEKEATA